MSRVLSLMVLTGLMFLACISRPEAAQTRYVEIKKPFANVYEYLDPKSTIIKQAKKGDNFELVYEGTSWYQVKLREKVGWLEKRAGEVVDKPNMSNTIVAGTVLVLLSGTIIGVFVYIYRQKKIAV